MHVKLIYSFFHCISSSPIVLASRNDAERKHGKNNGFLPEMLPKNGQRAHLVGPLKENCPITPFPTFYHCIFGHSSFPTLFPRDCAHFLNHFTQLAEHYFYYQKNAKIINFCCIFGIVACCVHRHHRMPRTFGEFHKIGLEGSTSRFARSAATTTRSHSAICLLKKIPIIFVCKFLSE